MKTELESHQAERAAAVALPQEIARVWAEMKSCSHEHEATAVRFANLARQQGLLLLEWRGHEQMKFEFWNEFFREHRAQLPEDLSQDAAERCIKVARAAREPIADFKQAVQVLADCYIAQELLPVPAREHPGVKAPLPPISQFMRENMAANGILRKFLEHHPWDRLGYQECAKIVSETRYQHDLHEEAKRRLTTLR